MSDITISESGDYFYIMQGDSDENCWPQYKEAASPDEEMIIRLCQKIIELEKELKNKDRVMQAATIADNEFEELNFNDRTSAAVPLEIMLELREALSSYQSGGWSDD